MTKKNPEHHFNVLLVGWIFLLAALTTARATQIMNWYYMIRNAHLSMPESNTKNSNKW